VTAVARGLQILTVFQSGPKTRTNQQIARETGLAKPTVSRLTATLVQFGYLAPATEPHGYQLGVAALGLGFTALANLDIRQSARPFLEELALQSNANAAIGMRDRLSMICVETCEGRGLVGLRLPPGMRIPLAVSALGRAYVAGLSVADREAVLNAIREGAGADWPTLRHGLANAIAEIETQGFCLSVGEWHSDINSVGAAIRLPDDRGVYGLTLGGPAYLFDRGRLVSELGPLVRHAAQRIAESMGTAQIGSQPNTSDDRSSGVIAPAKALGRSANV
jgi:DNA-binding IclR family transcriptional regulator